VKDLIPIAKPLIGEEEQEAVREVLSKSQIASGEYVERFEEQFAGYLNSKYAVSTSNGTTALHTAMLAAGIGPGDLVITTPFSFIATANAILYVGAKPLFADVSEESFNMDPKKIEELILETPGDIKAMVIVHLYGNPCEMEEIMEICEKYHIILIEDCAQAHGAVYKGKKVGTFGLASIFSFYPTKNMTCGEGGMLVTNHKEVYEKAQKIINHGQKERYVHDRVGYNYRMTNIAAAIGMEQLRKLEAFNAKRIAHAQQYTEKLAPAHYILPTVKEDTTHVFNQFTIRCKIDRRLVIEALMKAGVGYGLYYPHIIPEQPVYKSLGLGGIYPAAAGLSQEIISIPVHPALSHEDIQYVIAAMNAVNK
jgi:perosamine synthetase